LNHYNPTILPNVKVPFVSVTNNNNPCAGVDIALACVAVIRGGKNPDVVELTSNFALATGVP
jgi:hypothetical protein